MALPVCPRARRATIRAGSITMEKDSIQVVVQQDNGEGVPPLLWGGALSFLTFAFLAVMLAI